MRCDDVKMPEISPGTPVAEGSHVAQTWRLGAFGGSGVRLDTFLAAAAKSVCPDWALSRSRIAVLLRAGAIRVDGRLGVGKKRLGGQEAIEVRLVAPKTLGPKPISMALDVVFEDLHLMVLNKAAGFSVHPSATDARPTLLHGLLARGQPLSTLAGSYRAGIVHRLDRGTTGCLLVAKSDRAHLALSAMFAARHVEKTYLTCVVGRPKTTLGSIDTLYGRHPKYRQRFCSQIGSLRPVRPKRALTQWQMLAHSRGMSLLQVALKTGRTHQIRVHMQEMGHAILGDTTYGKDASLTSTLPNVRHQALHAWRLAFAHPITGQAMTFCAPLPQSWRSLINYLGASDPGPMEQMTCLD